jgi:hypothetical protein
MAWRRSAAGLLAAVALAAAAPAEVAAAGYQCRQNDRQERFEVQVDDPASGLPCRVVYWRTPAAGEILWQARYDTGFCAARLEELHDRFVGQGWACAPSAAQKPVAAPAGPPPVPDLVEAAAGPPPDLYRCALEGERRELRISVDDPASGLPCNVLYRAQAGGAEAVLWTARNEADFCVRKVTETIALWAGQGWDCVAGPAAAAADMTAAGAPSEATPAEALAPAARAEGEAEAVPRPAKPDLAEPVPPPAEPAMVRSPSEPAAPATAAAPAPAPLPSEPAADAAPPPLAALAPAAATPAPGAGPTAPTAGDALPLVAPDPAPGAADGLDPSIAPSLRPVLIRNIETLQGMTDGRLAEAIGGEGDLDGDGQADAVVIARYESPQPPGRLLLLAYLRDGARYHLADVELLDGLDLRPGRDVLLAPIADRLIRLRLADGGLACCGWAAGERAFSLAGRELTPAAPPLAASHPATP